VSEELAGKYIVVGRFNYEQAERERSIHIGIAENHNGMAAKL
jgi:hypothetical protein